MRWHPFPRAPPVLSLYPFLSAVREQASLWPLFVCPLSLRGKAGRVFLAHLRHIQERILLL